MNTILIIGCANAVRGLADGAARWIQLSPWGDFPHARGLQRVDRLAAARMAESLRAKSPLPIYAGHPDVPEVASGYTDGAPKGRVFDLEPRGDGLYAKVRFEGAGADLVANGQFRFVSPYWLAESATEGGQRILRPVELRSVGLTNDPNLPVRALSNQRVGTQQQVANARAEASRNAAREQQRRASDEFMARVREKQARCGFSYDDAWNSARATERTLYSAMASTFEEEVL